MKSLRLDPQLIRDDAKRVLTLVKDTTAIPEEEFLALTPSPSTTASMGELVTIFQYVRSNRFYKYTDAWGIGLGRIMELRGLEAKHDSFDRWCTNLRWVSALRMGATWTEFNADQVKMQGIEAMQKQLMIREKKRAAERLEKKAAGFEKKKQSLEKLNEAIAERRRQMLEQQRKYKQMSDPQAFAELLKSETVASPTTAV